MSQRQRCLGRLGQFRSEGLFASTEWYASGEVRSYFWGGLRNLWGISGELLGNFSGIWFLLQEQPSMPIKFLVLGGGEYFGLLGWGGGILGWGGGETLHAHKILVLGGRGEYFGLLGGGGRNPPRPKKSSFWGGGVYFGLLGWGGPLLFLWARGFVLDNFWGAILAAVTVTATAFG